MLGHPWIWRILTKFARIRTSKVCQHPTDRNEGRALHEGISLVPVIAVFTKYDQFRRETIFRLEDQGLDSSADPALLNAKVESIFKEQYLGNLTGSAPVVCLESENFIDQLACTTLIAVSQRCTSPAKSAMSLLKRLAMSSLVMLLHSCSWPSRRTIWS